MTRTHKKVTIKDIARIAEVSPTTVSLVLNNKKGVGKETRYRILRVASELKFTPQPHGPLPGQEPLRHHRPDHPASAATPCSWRSPRARPRCSRKTATPS